MTMRTKCRQPTVDACGRCLNCIVDDCGSCLYCLDNPRFGGIWKLQKKCMYRPKCLRKDTDTTAITSERSSSAKYLLQGVSPDNFTMSEILSFPVVFSYHAPTASSRTASVVPIAPVLPFALQSADASPAADRTDPSTKDSSGDPKNDEGLNAPSDVAGPTRTNDVEKDADSADDVEKHGGSATSDTAGIDVACSEGKSNVAGNEAEGLKLSDNNSACIDAAMSKESEENDVVYVDTASTPDHGNTGGTGALAPPQIGTAASELKGPFVTEEEAEASQKEAESQQKQWDKLMKSSVARFERRRAGGKNYSRVPSSRRPGNESDGSDGDRTAEGVRRSRRKRRPRSRRGGDDDEDDSSISEAEPEKRKERRSTPKEITSGPATDFPSGWTTEKIRRGSDHSRIDHFWYSPVLKKKFRSRLDVERFLAKMEIARDRLGIALAESGDEAEASEASEASEAIPPTKEPALSKESNTTSAIGEEDQVKVEELAWTLLQEDGRRR